MERPERRAFIWFGIRVAVLLVISLLPLPWLADGYSEAFAAAMNPVLAVAARASPVALRFDPPPRIRARGSWELPLEIEVRETKERVPMPFDVRSFSYRPIVTFLALALASPLGRARRYASVLGLGLLAMATLTTGLMALPIVATLGSAGLLGGGAVSAAIETTYRAVETPVMMYFIPTLVWWLLLWRTRPPGAAW